MRDRTNREKPHLGQTIKGIGMMYECLQSLMEEEYGRDKLMFAIMAGRLTKSAIYWTTWNGTWRT